MTIPKKCLHIGCINPQDLYNPLQLGLCVHHYYQVHNPSPLPKRQNLHLASAGQEILNKIAEPGDTLRSLSQKTGLPKDVIRHIRLGTWKHIQSGTWEKLQEAWAYKQFNQQHKEQQ